jgi:hypothetical protein
MTNNDNTPAFKYYEAPKFQGKGPKVPVERLIAYDAVLVAVYEEGMTVSEACEKHGVCQRLFLGMMAHLRRRKPGLPNFLHGRNAPDRDPSVYSINPETGRLAVSREAVLRMRMLRDQGYTRKEIAERFGLGHSIVAKYTEPAGSCYYSYRANPAEPFGLPHA